MLDPVHAYDLIAPDFPALSLRREAYLRCVEGLIQEETGSCRSLLDVGAGDGVRSLRIAAALAVKHPVLLEPSPAMRRAWPPGTHGWPIRAQDLQTRHETFDVIVCLWNVLGHIFPAAARRQLLRDCARLLAPQGLLFIDVSHRYNARHYGALPTLLRLIHDYILPSETNGDVVAKWDIRGKQCATAGHVFTDSEFRALAASSKLEIRKCVAIDYSTGEICNSKYHGHLFYVLRAARI